MKTNSIFRVLAVVSCATAVAFSSAGDDRASLDRAYKKLTGHLKSMNGKALYAMLASDFMWVEPNGKTYDKASFIAMDQGRMKTPGLKFHEVSMKNDAYDFMGDLARVRSNTTIVMSMLDSGKRVKFKAVEESVDTWRKTKNGWLCVKVETTSSSFAPL